MENSTGQTLPVSINYSFRAILRNKSVFAQYAYEFSTINSWIIDKNELNECVIMMRNARTFECDRMYVINIEYLIHATNTEGFVHFNRSFFLLIQVLNTFRPFAHLTQPNGVRRHKKKM